MHCERDAGGALSDAVRTTAELGEMARRFYPQLCQQLRVSEEQHRVLKDIMRCRTAAFGGHLDRCTACGDEQPAYNSCRNRHCPKCQGSAARRWLEARQADLLPVEYYHLVFTLPAPLSDIALYNKSVVYSLLFQAAAETLRTIAADPRHLGARIGATLVWAPAVVARICW